MGQSRSWWWLNESSRLVDH